MVWTHEHKHKTNEQTWLKYLRYPPQKLHSLYIAGHISQSVSTYVSGQFHSVAVAASRWLPDDDNVALVVWVEHSRPAEHLGQSDKPDHQLWNQMTTETVKYMNVIRTGCNLIHYSQNTMCEIWGSHGGVVKDWSLLGCDAVPLGKWFALFQWHAVLYSWWILLLCSW
jgi:hypothetical protein